MGIISRITNGFLSDIMRGFHIHSKSLLTLSRNKYEEEKHFHFDSSLVYYAFVYLH